MHLGLQGCADTKKCPAHLAFRTILGSSENIAVETVVPVVPETGIEPATFALRVRSSTG